MGKNSLTQFDFSGGELPPIKHGRTDDPLYNASVDSALNTIPRVEGPLMNRPGTERLFTAATRIGDTRLIPLDPVQGKGVLLEFSDQSIRILTPPAYGIAPSVETVTGPGGGFTEVVSSKTILMAGAGIVAFNPNGTYNYYNTIGGTEWYRLYTSATTYYEVSYYTNEADKATFNSPYSVINSVDLTTGVAVTTLLYHYGADLGFGILFGGWFPVNAALYGNAPTTLNRTTTTESIAGFLDVYLGEEIADIRYTFSGDTIYLAHDQHPPAILYRGTDDTWTYQVIPFTNGPYNPITEAQEEIQLSVDDFDYQVSLYVKGTNFSSYNANDYISYKHNGEYTLAKFVSLDGTETDRAIIKPVKSIVTGLDVQARVEHQPTNPAYSYVGTLTGLATVSTDKSVFSPELEGSYLRFEDIASTGEGVVVNWVLLGNYLGTDIATTGFYSAGSREVDVMLTDLTVGVLVDVTDFTEFDQVDGVSATAFSDSVGILNDTYVNADADIFNLTVVSGVVSGNDLGRQLQVVLGTTVLSGTITSDGSNSENKARVIFDGPLPYTGGDRRTNEGTTKEWRLGAFWTGNYPSSVAIFSQRLVLGGTPSHPETIWNSKIDKFFNFSPRTIDNQILADTGFSITLGGPRLSRIRWIYSGSQLLVGMEGSIWMVSSTEGVYTPFTAHPRKQSEVGSILPPVQIGVILLLVHASGRQIHQLRYDDGAKSYDIDDGSVVPSHLFEQIGQRITDIMIQNAPQPIIWLTREDGLLCSLIPSWSSRQAKFGLSRHTLGTSVELVEDTIIDELTNDVEDELAEVLSADSYQAVAAGEGLGSVAATAALYDSASGREQLYTISNRGLIRYIDRMSFNYDPDTAADRTEMLYLDSALVRSVTVAKTVWDEFAEYEGEVVTIVADGILVAKNVTFAAGDYTLVTAALQMIVGYSYTARMRSLPTSLTNVAGNSGTQGRTVRHTGVSVRMKGTLNLSHGSEVDDLIVENFENNDDILNKDDLHTGDVHLSFHGDRKRRSQYYLEQNDPYPMHILSITEEIEVS